MEVTGFSGGDKKSDNNDKNYPSVLQDTMTSFSSIVSPVYKK